MEYQIILFLLFVILQVIDVVTTIKALKKAELVEGNPFLKSMFEKIGVTISLVLIKVLVIMAIGTALYFYPTPIVYISVASVCIFYVWVVINNIKKGE